MYCVLQIFLLHANKKTYFTADALSSRDKNAKPPRRCVGAAIIFSIFKKLGAEISFAGVGQDGDHGFARAKLFGHTQGGGYVGAAGNAAEYALLADKALGGVYCPSI